MGGRIRRSRLKLAGAASLGIVLTGGAYGVWSQRPEPALRAQTDPLAGGASAQIPSTPPGNRLAHEASPYLQLHADNPVDWYPWGEEAFARARAEDRPVFLSIGYSTCYWCHVMERKVFSDPEIAAFMNAHFVSIKVDREERPDVDDVYMKATLLFTRSGGWPNSIFLTPEGQPFYAGSYFPPEDGPGRPGFPRLLGDLHAAWTNEREKVMRTAEQATERLRRMTDLASGPSTPLPPPAEIMRSALERLRSDFDAQHGGFGGRTKFPRPPALDLLLTALEQKQSPEFQQMLVQTLDAMALGGLYDQLGDGFHRYSTEPSWSIPHFEKMLYDNAQLVSVYARAYSVTRRPLYRRVVERTLAYLDREMSHPEGGYFSAQDAAVDGVEGASYLWSQDEVERVLGRERARAFFSVYRLAPMPEHPQRGVLRVRIPLPQGADDAAPLLARLDEARASLLAERAKRPQPPRDDKVLAAWNGLAIRGLVDAADALGEPAYLQRAERAAHFVLARLLTDEGTLRRSYIRGQSRERGVLDDYAFLADGLLALHGATGDDRWLGPARRLVDVMLARFEDGSGGGFFLTPDGSSLLVRPKPFEDNATPSGNAVALRVLRALARTPGSERYARAAAGVAASAGRLIERAPAALPSTVAVLVSTPAPDLSSLAGASGGSRAAAAGSDSPEEPQLPRSEDHVRARLVRVPGGESHLAVHLDIDEGWHVNANPASFPFLIATTVEGIEAGDLVTARYPKGESFRPAFADEAIQVYEGRVEIPVTLSDAAGRSPRLAVRFQACDDSQCLPPDRSVIGLDARAEASP